MKELSSVESPSSHAVEVSGIEQIRELLDATGKDLEEDAQLEERASTTDWDTLAITETKLELSAEQKDQYVKELDRLRKKDRDKEPVEELQACLHRAATVDMDRLVATLVQIKMKAKALENVITRQYLEAVHVGKAVDEKQQIAADISNARGQCEEVLMTTLLNTSTREKRIDDNDL